MAQDPATPKWHRYRMRLLAALGLTSWAHRVARADSEGKALDLRMALRHRALASQPVRAPARVTFLIPMVAPHQVGNWQVASDHLRGTLQSFLDQSNPNWQAIICCQERPPLPDDDRITWLPFDDPTPGNDKWRKLAALCDHLAISQQDPGYVMTFDADDLLTRTAVAEMLETQAPGGYLVEQGFVKDVGKGDVALTERASLSQPLHKPFWKLCGSCMALPFDPQIPQYPAFLRAMVLHEHRMFPYLARLAGLNPKTFVQPAVLYMLNHGENFGARRGRVSFKSRFVQRFKITDRETLSRIKTEFPKH